MAHQLLQIPPTVMVVTSAAYWSSVLLLWKGNSFKSQYFKLHKKIRHILKLFLCFFTCWLEQCLKQNALFKGYTILDAHQKVEKERNSRKEGGCFKLLLQGSRKESQYYSVWLLRETVGEDCRGREELWWQWDTHEINLLTEKRQCWIEN